MDPSRTGHASMTGQGHTLMAGQGHFAHPSLTALSFVSWPDAPCDSQGSLVVETSNMI